MKPGYATTCPNCGVEIEMWSKPPQIGEDALAAERRATVERIRAALVEEKPGHWEGRTFYDSDDINAILDAEESEGA